MNDDGKAESSLTSALSKINRSLVPPRAAYGISYFRWRKWLYPGHSLLKLLLISKDYP